MSNSPWSDFPGSGSASQNPYAPTEFTTNLPMGSSDDIETRNKYLNHEASIQGIGVKLIALILLFVLAIVVAIVVGFVVGFVSA